MFKRPLTFSKKHMMLLNLCSVYFVMLKWPACRYEVAFAKRLNCILKH